MGDGSLHPVLRYLRRQAGAAGGEPTDRESLERFAARRDEAAFAALVRRHGPMVLSVCRRVLAGDAEDAFQATFLILARKAGAVRRPDRLAGWLYGVANRVARRARAAARRRAVPLGDTEPAVPPADDAVWRDLRPVLDAEINRLAEHYRLPFVLCYLEGRTNAEAARLLGCRPGTVLSRLARAREQLRRRLTRRGVTLSAGALAAALSEQTAPAAVAFDLAGVAVRLAAAGAAPANVTHLVEATMCAMWLDKVRVLAVAVLAAAAVGWGVLAGQGAAEAPRAGREEAPAGQAG
jgi:RNA polymerase sigma factor (sigma-70 family)